jgi:hypothetical protein
MRQKFVFVTAVAVCLSLALVPAIASERTVDRFGDRTKANKARGANGYEVPTTAELAQRIPVDARLSGNSMASTDKAAAMVSAAAKQEGAQALATLQSVVTMDLGSSAQADKIRSGAYEMLADLYEGTPSKQVMHLGMALQYSADPARRAQIENRIGTLGGDTFAIAFQQNNNTVYGTEDAGADDTCLGAVAVSLPHSETMSITPAGDHNWRSFDIPGPDGAFMRLTTISDMPGSFTDDTDLGLWDDCPENGGTQVAFNDDGGPNGEFTSEILSDCLFPGTYYVEVGGFFDSATPDNFDLEIEQTGTCVFPEVDGFEPDDDRGDAAGIGHPTSTPANANGWGRAKKDIQARTIFPAGDLDHATFKLTRNELVRMSTAGTHPTFFNGFASTAPTDNPDTILTLLYENEPDYGGRCNQPDDGYLPVCFTDADCPDPLNNPTPGLPPCIPIQLFTVPVEFENPLATNDDRGGGDFGSELLMCMPRTASGSPSATLQAGGGDWLVRVNGWSAGDFFNYELQVKNEVTCLFESEPNNDFPEATPINIGDRIAGVYDFAVTNPFSDTDLYAWDVDVPTVVTFEAFAPDANQSDTGFELYVGPDDAGDFFNTGISDDDGGSGFLSALAVNVPPASDLLGNTSADADYFLNVTSFYYNPNFYYELQSGTVAAPDATETEPNDTVGTANTISLGDTVAGDIGVGCDYDTYTFTLTGNTFVSIEETAGGDGAIELTDCAGTVLSCDDDSGTPAAFLPLIDGCLPAGTYCAQIRAYSPAATFAYELELSGTAGCSPTTPPTMSGDGAFTCLDFDTCP